MIENELDRRVIKTRQIIYEAFYSLMQEKQYDKITVQEIIDLANVGRSTFYSHFATKDELLESSIENMMEQLSLHMSNVVEDDGRDRLIPVVEFFQHVKENSRLIKSLIKGRSADLFATKFQSCLNERIETHLCSKIEIGKENGIPVSILINYISSTLIFFLKWWLDNKMKYTPAQMEQYFNELVVPSIQAISSDKSSKD